MSWGQESVFHRYGLVGGTIVLVASLGVLPAPVAESDKVTLLFTGDVLVHTPVTASASRHGRSSGLAHDFSPMFSEVSPLIDAADWAICHLEVAIGVPGVVASPFPLIAAPALVAEGLAAAGFDACSTASNHSLDFGAAGVASTIASLDAADIAHTGTANGPGDANGILYEVAGMVIGHASYSYGFNGFSVPNDQPWLANQIDPIRIVRDASRLRRVGADFVVVSLHWGAEYNIQPISYQTDLARELAGAGVVDLVIGHHAHVVQPVAVVGGTSVAYGLGNFLSNQTNQRSQDGVMLVVELEVLSDGWSISEIGAVPTWVDRSNDHMIRDALSSTINGGILSASAARTGEALGLMGETVRLFSVDDARRWVLHDHFRARLVNLCGRGAC